MFGFDLISIIAAAIGGGGGALLGGLLASLTKAKGARVALVAGFAAVGGSLINPLVKPQIEAYLGPQLRGEQFDATYNSEFLPELKKIPAFARIFRDHPEVEKRLREKARDAYSSGGPKGLAEAATAIGASVIGESLAWYLPRARGQDLIFFAQAEAEILAAFDAKDPEACILYQFGPTYGRPLGTTRLMAAIGEDLNHKQLDVVNAIVVNAADQPIAFDKAKAGALLTQVGQRYAALLTGKSSEVAQGARPPADTQEAKAACDFAAAVFKDIAAMDAASAELALRKTFTPG